MLFSIFYFSGTGNTRWAAEQFKEILTAKGQNCEAYSIDLSLRPDPASIGAIIDRSDYTGFAYPVYGANLPPIMKAFIESVKDTAGFNAGSPKNLFLISTAGYIDSFGPLAAKRLFKGGGFRLKAYLNLKLCNNISSPKIKSSPLSEDKLESRKKALAERLATLADRLLKTESYITGIRPYLIPGILIRKLAAKGVRDNYLSLGVRTDTCSKCMLCVNNCPTKSIACGDRGFLFKEGCTACMRCYNFCPTYSITLDGKYADPEEYCRYRGPLDKSR